MGDEWFAWPSHWWTDPSVEELAADLDLEFLLAIGILSALGRYAMEHTTDGVLTNQTARRVAIGIRWRGDPETLFSSLKSCGLLDDDGRLRDWEIMYGERMEQRDARRIFATLRQRKRRKRIREEMKAAEAESHAADEDGHAPVTSDNVTVTRDVTPGHATTVPNRTGPDKTGPTLIVPREIAKEPEVIGSGGRGVGKGGNDPPNATAATAKAPTPLAAAPAADKPPRPVGNPKVQAFIDGVRAMAPEFDTPDNPLPLSGQDRAELKGVQTTLIPRLVAGYVKVRRGEWGSQFLRQHLSITELLHQIHGFEQAKRGANGAAAVDDDAEARRRWVAEEDERSNAHLRALIPRRSEPGG
jgi:hypothetical protein